MSEHGSMPPPELTRQCSKCGQLVASDTEFCPNCGHRIPKTIHPIKLWPWVFLVFFVLPSGFVAGCSLITFGQDPKGELAGIPLVVGIIAGVGCALAIYGFVKMLKHGGGEHGR